MFDVRRAWEQGIGYTPQTGNEKLKQIDSCLCVCVCVCVRPEEKERRIQYSQGGMQIEKVKPEMVEVVKYTLNQEAFKNTQTVWGQRQSRNTHTMIFIGTDHPKHCSTSPMTSTLPLKHQD